MASARFTIAPDVDTMYVAAEKIKARLTSGMHDSKLAACIAVNVLTITRLGYNLYLHKAWFGTCPVCVITERRVDATT